MLNINASYLNPIERGLYIYTNVWMWKRWKHVPSKHLIRKLYQILGVSENCEDETLRLSFVHLAKRFHPDSGSSDASAERFSEIEHAYREIRRIRSIEKDTKDSSVVEEFDIKHTAPQHRHYLTYNIGVGSTSKRQKQYQIQRAQNAIDNLLEHRLKKLHAEERNTLMGIDKQRTKDIKTKYGTDRLVEDLIQEAMSKGEFDDLPGMGKPLNDNTISQNPYVDFVTHKLNQILIDNGFTPEWIQLSKEIKEEELHIYKYLTEVRNELGCTPLASQDELQWQKAIENQRESVISVNKKIDKYNLLVPVLQKQMVHIQLEKIAKEVISKPLIENQMKQKTNNSKQSRNEYGSLLDMFTDMFSKKT